MRAFQSLAGSLLAIHFFVAPASAETVSRSATSTIEMTIQTTPDGPSVTTRETQSSFDVGVAAFGCGYKAVLLKNEVRISTEPSGMERAINVDRVTIVAHTVDEDGSAPLYTVSLEGDDNTYSEVQSAEISTESGLLSVAIGNPDIWNQRIHDLATGKFLLLSTTTHNVSSLSVEGDCTRQRFVAASLPYDVAYDPSPQSDKLIARITYASPNGPIARVLLSGTDAAWGASGLRNPDGVPPLDASFKRVGSPPANTLGRIPSRGADAQTFTELAISVRLPNGSRIDIPVIEDTIDLAGATLPEGLTLTPDP